MGFSSFLRSPKKEEQEVPNSTVTQSLDDKQLSVDEEIEGGVEFEGVSGIEDEEIFQGNGICGQLTWDFMGCEEFLVEEYEDEECEKKALESTSILIEKGIPSSEFIKGENLEFGVEEEEDDDDDEENKLSLKLNLNYHEVINAWSDRGSFWADDYSLAINNDYMREVATAMPVTEEVERSRRAASVLRYKEKRHTRLFSKKIRYQVRKLNADKRPRLKGRFVKRIPEETQR